MERCEVEEHGTHYIVQVSRERGRKNECALALLGQLKYINMINSRYAEARGGERKK